MKGKGGRGKGGGLCFFTKIPAGANKHYSHFCRLKLHAVNRRISFFGVVRALSYVCLRFTTSL